MADAAPALSCDVLVTGGGVAGISAAVSAVRKGCSVVLVEQHGQLGGTGTRGLLRTICGLYLNGKEIPRETLNKGIVREIEAGLKALAPERTVRRTGKVHVLPYAVDHLTAFLGFLCSREARLQVLLRTRVLSATARDGFVSDITAEGDRQVLIRPRVVIDATGNGETGFLAGAAFDLASPDERQMSGYTVRVTGLSEPDGLELKVPLVLAGVRDSRPSSTLRFTTFAPGEEPGEGFLKFNSAEPAGPERERQMNIDVSVALEELAGKLPAFRNAAIAGTSAAVADREGRRIRGEYVLTGEDVLSARKFSDGAVRNSWPIELWDRSKGTVYRYVPAGDYYEIPFRCLAAKGFKNLLAAGRCISTTHEALGSARVMGCCMATGDAAGRAAASYVKTGEYGDYMLNQ